VLVLVAWEVPILIIAAVKYCGIMRCGLGLSSGIFGKYPDAKNIKISE